MVQRILLPARVSTILISFAVALVLELLPWWDLRYVPDFVALVIAFWCIRQPRMVGLGAAWALGLVMDTANGALLGQHALSYSILAFIAITLSRRVLWFGIGQQALHVAALLLLCEAVSLFVRMMAGAAFPGWAVFVGPLLGALLWPVITALLLMPQRRPVDIDETRPL